MFQYSNLVNHPVCFSLISFLLINENSQFFLHVTHTQKFGI